MTDRSESLGARPQKETCSGIKCCEISLCGSGKQSRSSPQHFHHEGRGQTQAHRKSGALLQHPLLLAFQYNPTDPLKPHFGVQTGATL